MSTKSNRSWVELFNKYSIKEEIEKNGLFHISSAQIKEYREPRLMAKWDSSEQLPKIFKNNKINILPTSRSSYVLGNFELYEKFPDVKDNKDITYVELPYYETISKDNITTESAAINALLLTNILEDFIEEPFSVQTFNGRMGTGNFSFSINTYGSKEQINVESAQIEIDAGLENDKSVIIIEAKNVIYEDFHIRQLYYPYVLWSQRVSKPIRLIFSVYSNKIFNLYEYVFTDLEDFSSIELNRFKRYSLENVSISMQDIEDIVESTSIEFSDHYDPTKIHTKDYVPFIQADRFDRIISLLENLHQNPMTDEEIAELMHFGGDTSSGKIQYRQSGYYYNAGKYLGLFEKKDTKKTGEDILVSLTAL